MDQLQGQYSFIKFVADMCSQYGDPNVGNPFFQKQVCPLSYDQSQQPLPEFDVVLDYCTCNKSSQLLKSSATNNQNLSSPHLDTPQNPELTPPVSSMPPSVNSPYIPSTPVPKDKIVVKQEIHHFKVKGLVTKRTQHSYYKGPFLSGLDHARLFGRDAIARTHAFPEQVGNLTTNLKLVDEFVIKAIEAHPGIKSLEDLAFYEDHCADMGQIVSPRLVKFLLLIILCQIWANRSTFRNEVKTAA